ncbi:protein-disulfide reductase DsbD domain-containing protein [Sediminibacterium goheungense]|uniref:Disulfide bond corrector protein DsbC n=1 Tax=Sediminibacterium goheungense TaxID=1086393 RepID=A0A4R6J0I2_9BACT|nr:protein-disulfide reductase DsbD domain-containing protein [Sediminibacterium goheungense]TDO28643.1 disulfide bond corrector protein DsbC [Sediminibacterium goheungense]
MKKIIYTLLFTIIAGIATAQIKDPVSWTFEAKKKSADTYEVVLSATIQGKWHIYSQKTGKGGPIPTKVSFKANPLLSMSGEVKEIGKIEKVYDEIFQTDVLYLSNKVQYVQTVKLKGKAKTNITGTIDYMVCDDSQCLPPSKKTFDIKLL